MIVWAIGTVVSVVAVVARVAVVVAAVVVGVAETYTSARRHRFVISACTQGMRLPVTGLHTRARKSPAGEGRGQFALGAGTLLAN